LEKVDGLSVNISKVLLRGLRKRCPHCGIGPIYVRWARDVGQCPVCGLVYERNPGDTWGWVIIGDRIPVAAGIVLVYFRFGSSLGRLPLVLFFAVLIVILIWTAPNRWGAAIALHYLSRAYWPDPADPLPPDTTAGH
jgi:uncharacterized protein (DUF983 family)